MLEMREARWVGLDSGDWRMTDVNGATSRVLQQISREEEVEVGIMSRDCLERGR